MKLTKASLVTGVTVISKLVTEKGAFGLVRVRPQVNGLKVQVHFDWDKEAYEQVVKLAKQIKSNDTQEGN